MTDNSNTTPTHIIIVSNRGPFTFTVRDGAIHAARGAGGLVTAISAIARHHEILWISCAMSAGDREWVERMGDQPQTIEDMQIRLILPEPTAFHSYYNVISNSLLWFVQHQLHDTPRSPVIDESVWEAWSEGYARINQQLAEAVAERIRHLEGRIIVMPQDYHLYLFPRYLRELVGDRVTIQSFLHIPFPGPEAWRVIPLAMRRDLIDAMLQAERVGFQTERDTRRFLQTVADVVPGIRVTKPWRQIRYQGRLINAEPYPISVDVRHLESRSESREVHSYARRFRAHYGERTMILRIDRVEPSKNILRGFMAFRNFLLSYPHYHRRVEMLALLVPSRGDVPEYKEYLRDIMALVGEINATLGDSDWEPVRVLLGNNYTRAIAALTLYDVLMVNPLADGMNLVAKEGVILNKRNGVVILSEEAGVAEEFGDASLLISPYDVHGTREALHQALTMSITERQERAQRMATYTQAHDIYAWFNRQLEDALRDAVPDVA